MKYRIQLFETHSECNNQHYQVRMVVSSETSKSPVRLADVEECCCISSNEDAVSRHGLICVVHIGGSSYIISHRTDCYVNPLFNKAL